MADQIRATPRNPFFGLFSDLVNAPLSYMSDPRRTQQMQGVASFLRSTGVPYTLENLSYDPSGRGLFTGAGGLGGTTRLRPEAAEAALTVAPFVGPAAQVGVRGATATGRALGPTAARMAEGYLQRQRLMPGVVPDGIGVKELSQETPFKGIRRFDDGGVEVGYGRGDSKILVTMAPSGKDDRMLSASLENIGGYPSGTGDATMAYVDALESVIKDARGRTVFWDGFTSESIQSDKARAIYDRLKAAGIPFEKSVFEGRSKNALSLTQEQLLNIDFDEVRNNLLKAATQNQPKPSRAPVQGASPMYKDPFGNTIADTTR
jgi:hypothetical protein